jgi:hypothetical protein
MERGVISQTVTSLYATTTAMPAGNVIAAAPGAGLSVRIDAIWASAMTTTTNQEIAFGPTTTALGMRRIAATKGDTISQRFGAGWMMATNTTFGIWLNTTGAIGVTVEYSIVRRKS